jgi:hypothetical protein
MSFDFGQYPTPPFPKPGKRTGTTLLRNESVIRRAADCVRLVKGSRTSMSGRTILWHPPQGGHVLDQDENQEPLLHIHAPVILAGAEDSPWFVRNNKEGIQFGAGSPGGGMRFVSYLNAGEDCANTRYGGLTILDCWFLGDGNSDKCLQLNMADGCEVAHCHFDRFITGISLGNSTYGKKSHHASVHGCVFYNLDTVMRANGTQVREWDNTRHNYQYTNLTQGGARFTGRAGK